jgi:hypothetical protein
MYILLHYPFISDYNVTEFDDFFLFFIKYVKLDVHFIGFKLFPKKCFTNKKMN